jgi:hypothetical protein
VARPLVLADWTKPSRKAILEMMTTHPQTVPRKLRAAIIGFGLDQAGNGPRRVMTGADCLVVGGSEETHAELLETMLRLEAELERVGRPLGELPPEELAEIAWRIDSPELHAIALHMEAGLRRRGQTFEEATAEELSELAGEDPF